MVQSIYNFDWLQYCLKATLQMHIKLCSSRAPTCTLIEPLNALNLSFYSYIESISMLGYDKNPFGDKSTYVTGFAKRGLPHTSDFQTSTIHNLTCVRAMDL